MWLGVFGYPPTSRYSHGVPKKPEYLSIAEVLKKEILAGDYDTVPFPSNGTVAERFDVNMKTAGRAIQQLVAEGFLLARSGQRAVVAPRELRATTWPMTGRYARARASAGLVFASDVPGEVRKDTVERTWVQDALPAIAQLLGVEDGMQVFKRRSHTYVDAVVVEDTTMFFPQAIVNVAPGLENDERIKVVALIEAAGHVVTRTVNQLRSREASDAEQKLFGIKGNSHVIEHISGTYGANGEPLEAVINIRPAQGNVITFETYEAPIANE